MKFCKNLQRVADLSNPEWTPFFTDYKKLKKLIKRLTFYNETDDDREQSIAAASPPPSSSASLGTTNLVSGESRASRSSRVVSEREQRLQSQQREGDDPEETDADDGHSAMSHPIAPLQPPSNLASPVSHNNHQHPHHQNIHTNVESIRRRPGEVEFFKLLHAEFHKAVYFVDRAIDEFTIREERIRIGMNLIKHQQRFHLWNTFARSVYRLYSDLLLLENFCIMTYCSFSKILKKHDKRTGFETKNAFMSNVVNNANFTHYTTLQQMIDRCQEVYSEVSDMLEREGQEGLYEDERLFIDMIHQLNKQP